MGVRIIDRHFVIDDPDSGEAGEFSENDVAGSEVTILATGRVTNNFTFDGSMHLNTGGEDRKVEGIVKLNDNIDIYDDGTDVFTIYVTAGGRVYIKRRAGADTADVTLVYAAT